ncbi:alpha/beta fold hydrolase [Umezawaea tangerina]|uniref:Pimeloyl-ACP methyl ester carboxylesterase n=1 Tax=Umezawaea tangerina TaxID=84725 RepID=A0A2T0TCN7_9PSEU|nr:alpha/beta hydrolase [Umezawaea tangerina]PRY43404.1 pimeloyl-ACP methyl ester carboxylesterase [Umezawaea tangerina]
MTHTQLTAPNRALAAPNGVTYAYRRFGDAGASAPPVLFLQHLRGNLDNWDPALVDAVAAEREVVLLDNAGVGGSTGAVPTTVHEMAVGALAFADAAGLGTYDLFGFSLGGFVAQEIALLRSHQVRRIVLAGTAPQGGRGFHRFTGTVLEAVMTDQPTAEEFLTLFYTDSEESRTRGMESLGRVFTRQEDRDEPTDLATREAQMLAISGWGVPDLTRLGRLAAITQPVLVANGDHDVMTPTENSYLLAGHLPDATLRIYPDAGHGFLNQYPAEFAHEVNRFLG